MKVIFVADVPSVAKVGQTKEVANGYARNYLFPRKLAVLANSNAAAAVDAHLKKLVKQHAIIEAEMSELAKKIDGMEITLRAKVGENDKLYGSITAADIAEALSKTAGVLIDKKNVALTEPIKQAGVCDVTIKFMHEITAVIKTCIVDENATDEMIAQAKVKKAEAKKEKAEVSDEPKKVKAVKEEKAASEKPAKEKKPKAEKAAKEEKPAAEDLKEEKAASEKPAKEKKAKAEKPAKEEKSAAVEEKAENAASEKPVKEKKAKAAKEEKVAAITETAAEGKKEKKPKAKAKKEDA